MKQNEVFVCLFFLEFMLPGVSLVKGVPLWPVEGEGKREQKQDLKVTYDIDTLSCFKVSCGCCGLLEVCHFSFNENINLDIFLQTFIAFFNVYDY